jgi:nuclear protein localization family protein 4
LRLRAFRQIYTVQHIAELLGLVKVVGWILGHETRPEKGFVFTAAAILMAAEMQLEAGGGVEETPFVTIQVAPSPEDGHVTVEAFQMSQQCMAVVVEEALNVDPKDPKACAISKLFTAIQEGKESKTVENNFFLTVVPIGAIHCRVSAGQSRFGRPHAVP